MNEQSLRVISLFGLFLMLGVAWACSENRRHFPFRLVAWGVLLQFAVGVLILRTEAGYTNS
jgi:concentrative nucleoside transporter, CNT family